MSVGDRAVTCARAIIAPAASIDHALGKHDVPKLMLVLQTSMSMLTVLLGDTRASGRRVATADRYFPVFHARLHAGHCNDPNGPMYFNGHYHLFMQQMFPWRKDWIPGAVGWGHLVSRDLVTWREVEGALVPGRKDWSPRATGGYYSGSATIVNGVPYLMFAGVFTAGPCADPWTGRNNSCSTEYMVSHPVNLSDPLLEHWTEPRTIIRPTEGLQPHGWMRDDPSQAWLDPASGNERWIFIGPTSVPRHVGGQVAVGIEQAWASDWRGNWTSLGDFFDSGPLGDNAGCCPTFVPELQGFSLLYQCDNGYWLGNYSWDVATPNNQSFQPTTIKKYFDSGGTETSAGKGFWDAKTHRYLFWLWIHGDLDGKFGLDWDSMMSVPRQMTVDTELRQLVFYPVKELERLRTRRLASRRGVKLASGQASLNLGVNSTQVDIEATFRWSGTGIPYGFSVGIAFFMGGHGEVTRAVYNSTSSQISLDRSRSSLDHLPAPPFNEQTALGGHVDKKPGESFIELRVLADRSVAEVFVQRGRATMSGRAYPSLRSSTGVAVFVENEMDDESQLVSFDVDVWEMASCHAN